MCFSRPCRTKKEPRIVIKWYLQEEGKTATSVVTCEGPDFFLSLFLSFSVKARGLTCIGSGCLSRDSHKLNGMNKKTGALVTHFRSPISWSLS